MRMLSLELRRAICTELRQLKSAGTGGTAMRPTLLLTAMVLFAGCHDSSSGKYSSTMAFAPTPNFGSQVLLPSTLPIVVIPGNTCPVAQEIAVATSFDIVV